MAKGPKTSAMLLADRQLGVCGFCLCEDFVVSWLGVRRGSPPPVFMPVDYACIGLRMFLV